MNFDKTDFWSAATPVAGELLDGIQRMLVLAPHPDDESLACAGLIRYMVEKEAEVHIILTTDGSRSHHHSITHPPARIATLRKSEMLTALAVLGVDGGQLTCYEATDSAMPAHGEDGFDAYSARLYNDLKDFLPQLIVLPYELDPHRDHRATWQLLQSALKNITAYKPIIWEYPIWLYEKAGEGDIPVLLPGELKSLDVTAYLPEKRQAINAHASQTSRLIADDPKGFMLTDDMIANFLSGKEYFMERQKINPKTTLSRTYFEKLYLSDPDPWQFETSNYEEAKYSATINAIPAGHYPLALEIGCSIGVLTARLIHHCDQLVAMDISETALDHARKRLEAASGVSFVHGAVPADFPEQQFNLIVMSEVGYYLSEDDLLKTRLLIYNALADNGVLLLVHWTHFVADYPLSGDQVHDAFAELDMKHLKGDRNKDYRLDVYKKRMAPAYEI